MLTYDYQIRIRYGETDKMGYLYYARYAHYFEIGRTETMRHIGFPYRKLEDDYGVMLPVKSMKVRYLRPGYYDDLVTVRSIMKDLPSERVLFRSEIYNPAGKLMCAGDVRLAFVDMKTYKSCPPPKALLDAVRPYFEKVPEKVSG